MSYSELSQDDQVLTAIKFIAVGASVPSELEDVLGEELMTEIRNPIGVSDGQYSETGAKQ